MIEPSGFVDCPECAGEGFFWDFNDTLVVDKNYYLKNDEKFVDGFLGHSWNCSENPCDFCEGEGFIWTFREPRNEQVFSPEEKT